MKVRRPRLLLIGLVICVVCALIMLVALTWSTRPVFAQQPVQQGNRQAALQVTLELASEFASGAEPLRQKVLELIDQQGTVSDQEEFFTYAAFAGKPDSNYTSLVAAASTQTFDYLHALHGSYARFRGAQAEGDIEWEAKQLKATQEYAALAAGAVLGEAQLDERDVSRLQKMPFAVRRPVDQQLAFVARLKTAGLSAAHLKMLLDSGRTDSEIASFQKQLLETPPDQIGASAVELLSQIAKSRRQLAADLNAWAKANPSVVGGMSAQTFEVGNPHDSEETVDLYIRPVSIPPDWKLSIVNILEQTDKQGATPTIDPSTPLVREVEPGKHYSVLLPAQATLRVASVVIPVGDVGANTTARWAVEGKIGDELIGGMMHEMNVPYVIPDLQLPPVGSAPAPTAGPASAPGAAPSAPFQTSSPFFVGIGVVLALFVFALGFLVIRRRQS